MDRGGLVHKDGGCRVAVLVHRTKEGAAAQPAHLSDGQGNPLGELFCHDGTPPMLYKVDIESTYRCIPIKESERSASHIVLINQGRAWVAGDNAMPRGHAGVWWPREAEASTGLAAGLTANPTADPAGSSWMQPRA